VGEYTRASVLGDPVDFGPLVEQELDGVLVALAGGDHERRGAVAGGAVHIGVLLEEKERGYIIIARSCDRHEKEEEK
jgi:hypothetical protein